MIKSTLFTIGLCCALLSSQNVKAQKAIFLHHSTGGNVFYEGNVTQWMTDYNTAHSTDFSVEEFAYPNNPWPWANYAYDYWKLWIDNSCDNAQPNIACLDYFTERYDLIIFKHCFPGAAVGPDDENPSVSSNNQTIANYKLQYRALRDKFDAVPNTKLMVWTLAPLHRNATNSDDAQRANEFVQWVKTEWLTEDGKSHPNISVFDFYGIVAELQANPATGQQYCLKYDYEASHDGDDSHPNASANQTAAPLFGQAIVNVLSGTASSVNNEQNREVKVYPTLIKSGEPIMVECGENNPTTLQMFTLSGIKIKQVTVVDKTTNIDTKGLNSGVYLVKTTNNTGQFVTKITIE